MGGRGSRYDRRVSLSESAVVSWGGTAVKVSELPVMTEASGEDRVDVTKDVPVQDLLRDTSAVTFWISHHILVSEL